VSEPGDRTEVRQVERTRLDQVEVTVVAEHRHGTADRRVDRTLGPVGHRVGDVERLEEQRRDRDGATFVGVEVRQLRVGTEATAGPVDCRDLIAQKVLRLVARD